MASGDKTEARINHLLQAERRRCSALLEKDIASLLDLVTADYVHTHGNGHMDDHGSYFTMVAGPICYTKMDRGDLSVRIYGDVAVMLGDLTVGVKPHANAENISVKFKLQQVWVEDGGEWRSCAYQATALP